MKVILNTDIEKVGEVGDIVEVKPGYARNYLFPRKMALEITKNNLYMMNAKKKKIQKKMEIEKLSAEELKQKLEEVTITIEKKAGKGVVVADVAIYMYAAHIVKIQAAAAHPLHLASCAT